MDLKANGGRNPLVDAAAALSLMPEEDKEMDEMRGEMTGYVTDKEGREMMARAGEPASFKGLSSGDANSVRVDEEDNVVAETLGGPAELPEGMKEPVTGSFEQFMQMLGSGGRRAP